MTSFQGSTNFKKFEKTYLRKREEGRKEGREGGRERGRQERSPDRWPSSHQSKGLPPTFPHWASQKPSQAKPKPNQTKPGRAAARAAAAAADDIQPTNQILVTYLLIVSL